MSKPAACVNDTTGHLFNPMVPGTGSSDVLIGGQPAWRANLDTMTCPVPIAPPAPAPHGPEKCYLGSFGVLINGQMAVRMGDQLVGPGGPNPVVFCKASLPPAPVLIGDVKFGLADPANMEAFCKAFCALMKQWDLNRLLLEGPAADGGDDDEFERRRKDLENLINETLDKAGVPPMPVKYGGHMKGTSRRGEFSASAWETRLNSNLLDFPMRRKDLKQLSNTLYHEARHAEQDYLATRRMATRYPNLSPSELSTAMGGTNQRVTAQAIAESKTNPLRGDTPRGALADAVNKSMIEPTPGHRTPNQESIGAHYRNEVLDDINNRHAEYTALPEEQDAFATGDATEDFEGCGGCDAAPEDD